MSVADFFAKEFSSVGFLATATKGGVFYAACYQKNRPEAIWAMVCLISYRKADGFNFGYKDMDETVGPVEDECPERILKLLTPTDSAYAIAWRGRCWEHIQRRKAQPKLTEGCRIRFATPITFADKTVRDTFTVRMDSGRLRLYDGYTWCRIGKWRTMSWTLIDDTIQESHA
jgi:hypothetical protein